MSLSSRRVRRVAVLSLVLSLALVLASCGGGDHKKRPTPATSDPTPVAKRAPAPVPTSPFTGLATRDGGPKHRVFVVKIENTANGAPQTGLRQADLVYEELVEGGLTRLGAFFYSKTPTQVGHVRSARATDIDMVKPTGGILIASGAASRTVGRIESAKVRFASEDTGNLFLSKDPAKVAPYNRWVDLAALAKTPAAKQSKPPRAFLPFGPARAVTSTERAGVFSVRFSRSTVTSWKYAGGAYERRNGHAARGQEFRAANVLVLKTRQADAGYLDPAGNPVPETLLTGRGVALLFRAGKLVRGVWAKKSPNAPFTLRTRTGAALKVPAGRTWIELMPKDTGSVALGR